LELLVKYWTPDLPERDVPHRDEVKMMIDALKGLIKERKARSIQEGAGRNMGE